VLRRQRAFDACDRAYRAGAVGTRRATPVREQSRARRHRDLLDLVVDRDAQLGANVLVLQNAMVTEAQVSRGARGRP
jgi:hypothetical protein